MRGEGSRERGDVRLRMTGSGTRFIAMMQEAWSTLRMQGSALVESAAGSLRTEHHHYRPIRFRERSPWLRRSLMVGGAVAFAAIASCGIVWVQLGFGAISIDAATPWLTSAIEDRLGGGHRVQVGGTLLERDEIGRSA